ncbi:unnamed protein product [Dracunculus medinensis]|uniref:DUF2040 domain-containing protein n=1 Tax=Dracunculus medinensis TaxID=318479 RepID=A0A0N4UCG4_DRAME|nr:unnamed protein product [Dracunculus medinensis]
MDMKEEYNFASSSSKWRKYDSRKCAINCDEKHFIDSNRDSLEKISDERKLNPPLRLKKRTNINLRMIDGIPERFFYGDEPAEQIVESANREAVIKKQNDNFKKAFNEAKERRKEEQAKEEENSARRREIEFIDEQIKCWQRVLNLQKRLEEFKKKFEGDRERAASTVRATDNNEANATLEDVDLDSLMDWKRNRVEQNGTCNAGLVDHQTESRSERFGEEQISSALEIIIG